MVSATLRRTRSSRRIRTFFLILTPTRGPEARPPTDAHLDDRLAVKYLFLANEGDADRALVLEPPLLLLDEPMAALDAGTRLDVRDLLAEELRRFGGAAVLVTHDPVDALALADRILVLEAGRTVQEGDPAEVAGRPATAYVARLVGMNRIPARDAAGAEVVLIGTEAGRELIGKRGQPLTTDRAASELSADDLDLLVIAGGMGPDKLRADEGVQRLVREMDVSGKPIAFICHAGWVPASAGILEGRRVTSYPTIADDCRNAGAEWEDAEVVVDGREQTLRQTLA